jgi:serine/threonine protein phosphatase PrpC
MEIRSCGISDTGRVRTHNEDNLLANDQEALYLVADGMGGLSKGDVASRIAVETIEDFVRHSRVEDITWPIKPQDEYSVEENRLLAAISLANWNIFSEFQKDEHNMGMGTTLVGLLLDGKDRMVLANVGDSRIYLIRDHTIEQLTDDHSLVMEEVRRGNMTSEEARNHPQKHVINRALGITDSIQVDISTRVCQPEDLYMLCSDGLSDMLPDEEILSVVESNMGKSLKDLGERLVAAASNQGGRDNITVVLVGVSE